MRGNNTTYDFQRINRYAVIAVLLWTAFIGAILAWSIILQHRNTLEVAENVARANFSKDLAFRSWASSHGGVYLEKSDRTRTNIFLTNIPDKEVVTTSGKALTLITPAHMLRQLMLDYEKIYGIKGRLAGLDPINPENAADAWESKHIKAFKQEEYAEVTEVQTIDGESYLRFMRPLVMEKDCLKCHTEKAFLEGEIHGGISVAVPLKPYIEIEGRQDFYQGLMFGSIYLLGLGGIGLLLVRGKQRVRERRAADEALLQDEKRMQALVESTVGCLGQELYDNIVKNIGKLFGCQVVILGELIKGGTWIRTLAMEVDGNPVKSMAYSLPGTPCEEVIKNGFAHFPEAITELFPNDSDLIKLKAEGYVGVPLYDSSRKVIGNLCALSRTKLTLPPRGEDMMHILGARAAGEIERTRSETALARSEQEWVHALDFLEDAIYLIGLDEKILRVNKAFCNLIGTSPERLVGKDINDVMHPLGERVPCPVCEARKERRDTLITLEAVHPENPTGRPIEVMVKVIRDKGGEPLAVLMGIHDLTRIRKDEENRIRLETAIEQAAESIVISDKFGNILYVNPSFERVTGYTRQEAMGKNPRILQSGRHDKSFYNKMWKQLSKGKVWQGRLVNKRKDGTLFEEEVTISPVVDSTGEIINYVAVKRDVSAEIKLQTQLRQSQKMEAIGTLAGGIAHDFNNILGIILGYTDMTLDELDPESRHAKNLATVLRAGKRAKELVRQILAFSRQSELEKSSVQVHSLLKEALKMLRSSIPATIEIIQRIDPHAGDVLGDPTQIHQVIMNLCTNAYHAMREKGGTLTVSLGPVTLGDKDDKVMGGICAPGRYVVLEVQDTGYGIEPELLDRIFEPYFTTKKIGEGTGLGLAVVHGIVENHHGFVTVKSAPGLGATFAVFLPIMAKMESVPERASSEKIPGGDEKILLVDDQRELAEMLSSLLESLGYQVSMLTSSKAAFEAFQSQPDQFDLVITDMTMPEMTGEDLARNILAIRPDMPIILCTGFSDLIDAGRAKSIGIKEFLAKPVTKMDLAQTVRNVLGV